MPSPYLAHFHEFRLLDENNRGRTASYPTAPSQIPACGITAQGSSKLLTCTRHIFKSSESMTDSRFSDSKVFYQFFKPFPIVAFAL